MFQPRNDKNDNKGPTHVVAILELIFACDRRHHSVIPSSTLVLLLLQPSRFVLLPSLLVINRVALPPKVVAKVVALQISLDI